MAQAFADNLWVLARGQQQRRAGMAEVVKAETLRQLGALKDRAEMPARAFGE